MYKCMYGTDSTSVRARGYCGSYSLGSLRGLVAFGCAVLCCVGLFWGYIHTYLVFSIYLSI